MKKNIYLIFIFILVSILITTTCNTPSSSSGGGGSDGGSSGGSSDDGKEDPTTQSGYTITIAGAIQNGSDDGIGTAARFDEPTDIIRDGTDLYITDRHNNTIRKLNITTGEVTTLAGSPTENGLVDGIGTNARFSQPYGITILGDKLYVVEHANNTIREIDISTAAVTTLSLIGSDSILDDPNGITTNGTDLFISDSTNHVIKKVVISTGDTTILAGSSGNPGIVDGIGGVAKFHYPCDLVSDGIYLYICDAYNEAIRKIEIATATVSTLLLSGDGDNANLYYPDGIIKEGTNLFLCDTRHNAIKKIVISTGEITVFTGNTDTFFGSGFVDGPPDVAKFFYPKGLVADDNYFYVCDTYNMSIRRVTK